LGANGGMPIGGVIDVGGTLYGTTSYGGKSCGVVAEHCATIFDLKMSTGTLTTLYKFFRRCRWRRAIWDITQY
jgi:hypothetical protein